MIQQKEEFSVGLNNIALKRDSGPSEELLIICEKKSKLIAIVRMEIPNVFLESLFSYRSFTKSEHFEVWLS